MRHVTTHDADLPIPLIDIAGFDGGPAERRRSIATQIDRAASEVGFMQVVGHGIPCSVIDNLAAAIDDFFALPSEQKFASRPQQANVNRGYTGVMMERLSYSLGVESAPDLFEAFNIGTAASWFPERHLPSIHYPENIWPLHPRDFRERVEAWFDHAGRLTRTMTRIFAVALGLPGDYFVRFEDHSIDTLRLNHYQLPPEGHVLEMGQMGMGGHTDYGIVTVLWADAVTPGLQIMDAAGQWHDVVPEPGALLINLGDLLACWTNERWLSTMHRVLPPIDANGRFVKRRSAAYFHDGNYDAVVACLPSCTDAHHPPLYAPITVGDHLDAKLRGSRGLTLNAEAQREATRLRSAGI